MSRVAIRSAHPDDAPAIQALARQLGYEAELESILRLLNALPRGWQLLVAEEEGDVIGWLELQLQEFVTSGPEMMICGLVVEEERRGRNIGRLLLEAAEACSRAKGLKAIRVRSRTSREAAHRFYLRHGYEIVKSQHVFKKSLD